MKISDVKCKCGAAYERAESSAPAHRAEADTNADGYRCEICGADLEPYDPAKLVVYRLVAPPEPPLIVHHHRQ
jgi:hypothetical protein